MIEKLLKIEPPGLLFIGGSTLVLNMSVEVLIWPLVFVFLTLSTNISGEEGSAGSVSSLRE